MTGIIVTGDAETDRALAALPIKLQKKGIRKATREAAKVVLADAKRHAPHDEGLLERSLTVRVAKRSDGRRFRKHVFGHAISTRTGLFTGETFYGGFVELGTKERFSGANNSGGKSRGRIEPVEFLREALYTQQARARQIFIARLGQALRQITRERTGR